MQPYLILVRRELASYFVSLSGYVILGGVAFLLGMSFSSLLEALVNESGSVPFTELFYNTQYFWLVLMLAAPVITMRTFAHEKATGTYETLMTAPVSDLTVVLAKFTGSLTFFMIMWIPLVATLFIIRHYLTDPSVVNMGTAGSTFFGILLIGSVYMALGCYASSLTHSQAVAAMISLAMGIGLYMLSFLALSHPSPASFTERVFAYVSMIQHLRDFSRGFVNTKAVTYYLTMTFFFLFLTWKSVESRRWK